MKNILLALIVLLSQSGDKLFSQNIENFMQMFLHEGEISEENKINEYKSFDFSNIWSKTEENYIIGIIGEEHRRLRVKLISIQKNPFDAQEYIIYGKSMVKNTICDFTGVIRINVVHELLQLQPGITDEFIEEGIKTGGILIADYELIEDPKQKNSGKFVGEVYTKWYLNEAGQIKYDDLQYISGEYMNNAFIGNWVSHRTGKKKICNWGDFRVPMANYDFDIGSAEFSPGEDYLENGWKNYRDAWLYNNQEAIKLELAKWWK